MNYAIVGCDYAARHPEVGVRIRSYYEARDDIRLLPCCRKDLSALQSGDTVTAGCTLCDLMLAERVPHVRRRSIYRLLLEDEGFAWPDYAGREMTLQDCWRMRHDARLQDDVRACLTRMNVRWHELSERREGLPCARTSRALGWSCSTKAWRAVCKSSRAHPSRSSSSLT